MNFPHIRMQGDVEAGKHYLGVAANLRYRAETIHKLTGAFASLQTSPDPYSIVRVDVCSDGRVVYDIFVAPRETSAHTSTLQEDTMEIPKIFSGVILEGGLVEKTDDSGNTYTALEKFRPTKDCAVRVMGMEPPAGFIAEKDLAVLPGDTVRTPDFIQHPLNNYTPPNHRSQYFSVAPSMYSGTMSKLVQLLLGYGKFPYHAKLDYSVNEKKDIRTNGVQVAYGCRLNRNHHLYQDDFGKWWVVELSLNSGMVAVPLELFKYRLQDGVKVVSGCNAAKEAIKLFGGFPKGTLPPAGEKLEAMIAAGKAQRLMTAEAYTAFLGGETYWAYHCCRLGWSTPDKGDELRTIFYKIPPTHGQRFAVYAKIKISCAKDGEGKTKLSASTDTTEVTEIVGGYAWPIVEHRDYDGRVVGGKAFGDMRSPPPGLRYAENSTPLPTFVFSDGKGFVELKRGTTTFEVVTDENTTPSDDEERERARSYVANKVTVSKSGVVLTGPLGDRVFDFAQEDFDYFSRDVTWSTTNLIGTYFYAGGGTFQSTSTLEYVSRIQEKKRWGRVTEGWEFFVPYGIRDGLLVRKHKVSNWHSSEIVNDPFASARDGVHKWVSMGTAPPPGWNRNTSHWEPVNFDAIVPNRTGAGNSGTEESAGVDLFYRDAHYVVTPASAIEAVPGVDTRPPFADEVKVSCFGRKGYYTAGWLTLRHDFPLYTSVQPLIKDYNYTAKGFGTLLNPVANDAKLANFIGYVE